MAELPLLVELGQFVADSQPLVLPPIRQPRVRNKEKTISSFVAPPLSIKKGHQSPHHLAVPVPFIHLILINPTFVILRLVYMCGLEFSPVLKLCQYPWACGTHLQLRTRSAALFQHAPQFHDDLGYHACR